MSAETRLLEWARRHACQLYPCFNSPMVAITATGALFAYCEQHAQEMRDGGALLIELPGTAGERIGA